MATLVDRGGAGSPKEVAGSCCTWPYVLVLEKKESEPASVESKLLFRVFFKFRPTEGELG